MSKRDSRRTEFPLSVSDYQAFRAILRGLNSELTLLLLPDDVPTVTSRLGLTEEIRIPDCDPHVILSVTINHAIYEIFHNGQNAVGRMLRDQPPPEDSLELRVLRALDSAHFSLFRVMENFPGDGVRVLDLFRKQEILLVDFGFSLSTVEGSMLTAHLFAPADGWYMTTGAALPVSQEGLELIANEIQAFNNRFHRDPDAHEVCELVNRASIRTGGLQSMNFIGVNGADDDDEEEADFDVPPLLSPKPIRAEKGPGRNDSCPCGSGKKFKKCCLKKK